MPTSPSEATAPNGAAETKRWVIGRRARVLLCASGVSFMIMLDSNIVAVSLPAIARNLGAAFTDIEWVVSAYILTFAAFLMPAGTVADRFGRRRLLVIGLAVFTVASLLCGLAPSATVLNLARSLQGLGAALQLSAALAVLSDEFRGPDRARAFAFWGTVLGVAVVAGPLIGGFFTSTLGWRWAFLINIPIGIALVVLAVTAVRESRDPDARRLDIAGMVLFGTGLACVVWALIGANAEGWASRETIAKLGSGAVLLVAFVIAEAAERRPMVDLGLFRDRTFLGAAIAMLGFAATAQVMMTYLPLYLQNAFGKDPLHAGVAMLPFALPLFFCPRIGANLATRIEGRSILSIGLGLVAAGNLLTAIMVDAALGYPLVAAAMFVTGCGAGLLNSETAKVMMSVVAPERAGMASGISGTLRFVGLVAGVTGLGLALVSGTERHFATATAQSGPALRTLVSRIVAGDIAGVTLEAGEASRTAMVDLARASFAAGFTNLLLIAAGVAAIAALSSYRLLGARAAR